MQHNQYSYTSVLQRIRSIMCPAGSESLARRDGEENDCSSCREPWSDSSALNTVMYSVFAVHSRGQIGSLKQRIGHMPITTSLIEMCQA
jgi:hypothetical protein